MVQTEFLGRLLLSVFIIVMILLVISILLPQFFGTGICKSQQSSEISNLISSVGPNAGGTIQKFTVYWCVDKFFLRDGEKDFAPSGTTVCVNYTDSSTPDCSSTVSLFQPEIVFSFDSGCKPVEGEWYLTPGTYFVRIVPTNIYIVCPQNS